MVLAKSTERKAVRNCVGCMNSLWEFWSKHEQTIVKLIATMQVPSQDPHFDSGFCDSPRLLNAILPPWMIEEPIPYYFLDLGTILIRPSYLAYLPKHTQSPPIFWGGKGNEVERTWTNLLFSKIYAGLVTGYDTLPIGPTGLFGMCSRNDAAVLMYQKNIPRWSQVLLGLKNRNSSIYHWVPGNEPIYRNAWDLQHFISIMLYEKSTRAAFFSLSKQYLWTARDFSSWYLRHQDAIQIWVNSHSSPIWIEMKVQYFPFYSKLPLRVRSSHVALLHQQKQITTRKPCTHQVFQHAKAQPESLLLGDWIPR